MPKGFVSRRRGFAVRYVLLGLGLACSAAALVVFLAAARAGSRSEDDGPG